MVAGGYAGGINDTVNAKMAGGGASSLGAPGAVLLQQQQLASTLSEMPDSAARVILAPTALAAVERGS